MADEQLLTLIRVQLANGLSKEGMRNALHIGGYTDAQIDEAFALLGASAQAPAAPPTPAAFSGAASAGAPAPQKRASSLRTIVALAFVLLVLLSGVAYAYVMNLGPFSHPPYTQQNLISGVLNASSRITSSTYKVSASFAMAPRDVGATPFTIQTPDQSALRAAYQHDADRMKAVSSILLRLGLNSTYPSSLQAIVSTIHASPYGVKISTTDPATGAPYQYRATSGGKDFALSVTFETDEAISVVRKMSALIKRAKVPAISGRTVTFTKDSSPLLFMSPEPPKPLLTTLSDMIRFLPPSMSASLSATAASDWTNTAGGFTFNVDANGDFGDLTYKINIDLLKKGGDYYFRINNLPDLFGGTISGLKGKWIVVSASATPSATSTDLLGMLASKLPQQEQQYQQHRAEYSDFLRTIASIADQEGLVRIADAPYAETVGGASLYHYDLTFNKDAIVPFYQRALEAASSTPSRAGVSFFADPGTLEYLKSKEFDQVFSYVQSNTKITLWTDSAGNPRTLTYTMRLVPPDTAVQLEDKQANLTLELDISNINQPVSIEPPADATPLQEVIKQAKANESFKSPF